MNFPEKVGVTATLSVEYKAPTKADQVSPFSKAEASVCLHLCPQFVVIRCKLVELKGRKAIVEGRIEDLNGTLLASATYVYS